MRFFIWIAFWAMTQTGCNLYSSLDAPSGDAQLLSAARACFDRGDYTCASDNYTKLSGSLSDIKNSETAYVILDQAGAGVGSFMAAVIAGGSSGGKLVTKLAASLIPTASQTTRLNIFHAYQKYALMQDTKSKGLVRFITSIALLSELLAEGAASTTLQRSDLATTPASCIALTQIQAASAPGNAVCGAPASNNKITSGASAVDLTTATDADLTGSPTLRMIHACIVEVDAGISQMQSSGNGAASAGSSLATGLKDVAVAAFGAGGDVPLYRYTLLSLDVGVN